MIRMMVGVLWGLALIVTRAASAGTPAPTAGCPSTKAPTPAPTTARRRRLGLLGAVDSVFGRRLGAAASSGSESQCAKCCAASAGPSCDAVRRRLGGAAAAACRRRLAGAAATETTYTECHYPSPTPAPTPNPTNAPTSRRRLLGAAAASGASSGKCASACFEWSAPTTPTPTNAPTSRRRLLDLQTWNREVGAAFGRRLGAAPAASGETFDACTCGSCCCETVEAAAAGGHNMFAAQVEVEKLVHSIAVIVLITMVLEQGLHKLTHFLHHAGLDMFIEILHKLQGELMILGFISFITLMIVQFFSSTKFVSQNLLMFELAHVWIFAVGLLYAATGLIWMLIGEYFKDIWMTFQKVPLALVAEEGAAWEAKRGSGFCASDLSSLVKFTAPKEELLEFHLLRKYFLSKWKKEMTHVMGARRAATFTFGSYLSFAATTEFVEQLEVNLYSWIIFVLTTYIILGFLRYGVGTNSLEIASCVFGWGLLAMVLFMNFAAKLYRLSMRRAALAHFGLESHTPLSVAIDPILSYNRDDAGVASKIASKIAAEGGHGDGDDDLMDSEDSDGPRRFETTADAIGLAALAVATGDGVSGLHGDTSLGGAIADPTASRNRKQARDAAKKSASVSPSHGGEGVEMTAAGAKGGKKSAKVHPEGGHGDSHGSHDDGEHGHDDAHGKDEHHDDGGHGGGHDAHGHGGHGNSLADQIKQLKKGGVKGIVRGVQQALSIPRLMPVVLEVVLLFELCILSYALMVNLPLMVGYRLKSAVPPALNVFLVSGTIIPVIFAMFFVQPTLLKSLIMINSIMGKKHHVQHLMHETNHRENRSEVRTLFCA